MHAADVGRHLLAQGVGTWDERELGFCQASGRLYWLAQLLRSRRLACVEVCITGNAVSLPQLAAALAGAPLPFLRTFERGIFSRGLEELRQEVARTINLAAVYDCKRAWPTPL